MGYFMGHDKELLGLGVTVVGGIFSVEFLFALVLSFEQAIKDFVEFEEVLVFVVGHPMLNVLL